MRRVKSVTLIAAGLAVGLLPIWAAVEGTTAAADGQNQARSAPTRAERAERIAQRRARAEERIAAQQEESRLQDTKRAPLRGPQQSLNNPGTKLTPAFDPAARSLTVDGDIELGAASNISKAGSPWLWDNPGDRNVGVGSQALASVSSGMDNTAIGYQALHANTIGGANAALGTHALSNNLSGTYNSAFGSNALWLNESGDGNSAFGAYALYYNQTGFGNTAFGANALLFSRDLDVEGSLKYGAKNTAVGSSSLRYNTIGQNNVAVGYHALHDNSDGSSLTAVGFRALANNTSADVGMVHYSGIANTSVGAHSLGSNTTGFYNTAVGVDALYENLTGYGNTAIGVEALYANNTGYYNTAIGHRALRSPTGNWNIGIGYKAGTVIPPVGNTNILIGNYGESGDSTTIRLGRQFLHNKAYVAGIYSTPTPSPGLPSYYVNVTTKGQLAQGALVVSSSRRFKREIRDMGEASQKISELRPVTFRFDETLGKANPGVQFGLVAEEVAEILPQLVRFDDEGRPTSVDYKLLTPLLLNELQAQQRLVLEQSRELIALKARLERLEVAGSR